MSDPKITVKDTGIVSRWESEDFWPPKSTMEQLKLDFWKWEIYISVSGYYKAAVHRYADRFGAGTGDTPAQAMAKAIVDAGIAHDYWPEAERLASCGGVAQA